MHLFDPDRGMLGANGIVAGGDPHRRGGGAGAKASGCRGDGLLLLRRWGLGPGVLHEGLNLAALWRLPVLFVLENNRYASTTSFEESHAFRVKALVEAYGIPYRLADGCEVEEVYVVAGEAVKEVREGKGPAFLEVLTYRFKGHYVGDPERYRSREEVERARREDPLARHRERLLAHGVPEERLRALEEEEERLLQEAVAQAERSPWPDPEEALRDLFAEPVRDYPWEGE